MQKELKLQNLLRVFFFQAANKYAVVSNKEAYVFRNHWTTLPLKTSLLWFPHLEELGEAGQLNCSSHNAI